MMKHEFEELAGYEVSNSDYDNIIEPMYMATNLTKAEFVKVIDKKRFALRTEKQLINCMRKEAKHLAETCHYYTDFESKERLQVLIDEYMARFCSLLWSYIHDEYEYPNYRGCSFPQSLVICTEKGRKVKEIIFIK